jgi:hypothetical protein
VERKMVLLDLLKQAREMEMHFVDALSGQERARIGTLEDWAAKDVISHIAAWKARMADNLLVVSGWSPCRVLLNCRVSPLPLCSRRIAISGALDGI